MSQFNPDTMTPAEFQERLPELVASDAGKTSEDPKFAKFFAENPDCLALIKDLEAIADAAASLFAEDHEEPSDNVWSNIASKLKSEVPLDEEGTAPQPI